MRPQISGFGSRVKQVQVGFVVFVCLLNCGGLSADAAASADVFSQPSTETLRTDLSPSASVVSSNATTSGRLQNGFCRPGEGCVTCSEPSSDPKQLVLLAGLAFWLWKRQQP